MIIIDSRVFAQSDNELQLELIVKITKTAQIH